MSKYYCKKCKKYHHRGKIYIDHLNYKKKVLNELNSVQFGGKKVNIDGLRPIAKRQLHRLLKKIISSGNYELYKNEIIKLMNKEKGK
ncbi:MAG: hypothetical protein ACFFD7_00685 [Candidatus Thorarchaeota archaeon]